MALSRRDVLPLPNPNSASSSRRDLACWYRLGIGSANGARAWLVSIARYLAERSSTTQPLRFGVLVEMVGTLQWHVG